VLAAATSAAKPPAPSQPAASQQRWVSGETPPWEDENDELRGRAHVKV